MTPEDFRVLAAKLRPHTQYLYLHLLGEPLLHPQLDKILKIAAELDFKVIITTNGTLLDKQAEILLALPAVHKLNISLQSFEANSRGVLDEYINICAEFVSKAAASGKICVLRLWNNNGLDSLNERIEGLLENCFPKPWRESRGSRSLAERVWLEPGDKFDWPDMGAEDRGDACFCYGLRDQIGVLCDGTVVPCCLDSDGVINLGNIFAEDINSVLNSERALKMTECFAHGTASEELCKRCGYAQRFSR